MAGGDPLVTDESPALASALDKQAVGPLVESTVEQAAQPSGTGAPSGAAQPSGGKRTLLGLASLSGTIWVAGGSALLGASGYTFLTLTARIVPAADYASLAALYLLVATVGPSLFIPVEQETTRLISRWHALGQGTRDVIGQMAIVSAGMAAVAVVGLVVAGPWLLSWVFDGNVGLLVALIVSVIGYGGACLVRGVFAGERRLRDYGVVVGADGLARLIPCVALVVAGFATALPYGLALGFGSVAALGVGLVWFRPGTPGPVAVRRELLTAIGWLVAAWGASFALANIAPVIVKALMPDDEELPGVFAFAFVVARVPVFVLLSLQAILLPALSRAAATRDLAGLRRGMRQAMIVVGVLGVGALLTTAPLCLWLIGVVFPHSTRLSALTVTVLAVGTILAMVVQVLQPALIAVAGHRVVAAAWLAGVVVFSASFALPVGPIAAATLAQVVAGVATTSVMGVALLRHLHAAEATPVEVAG